MRFLFSNWEVIAWRCFFLSVLCLHANYKGAVELHPIDLQTIKRGKNSQKLIWKRNPCMFMVSWRTIFTSRTVERWDDEYWYTPRTKSTSKHLFGAPAFHKLKEQSRQVLAQESADLHKDHWCHHVNILWSLTVSRWHHHSKADCDIILWWGKWSLFTAKSCRYTK